MARMHGEHKKDYASRQYANVLHFPHASAAASVGPIYVDTCCTCSDHDYPHIHSREQQRRDILRWNAQSRHKLSLPK